MAEKISVVIPNWNGRKLLEKNLPKVLAAIKNTEVIIVDDASSDDTIDFLVKNYPQIKLIRHEKNLGFSASVNEGVRIAKGKFVALFNVDVYPEKDILKYVLPHFDKPDIFAVSLNESKQSWAKIIWKNGFFEHESGLKTKSAHISGWASGGSAVFRKSIWDELGGFDPIYYPFYWEDIDISYRAWKRGYKILWEPKGIVYHQHEATIGAHYSRGYIDFISQRNQLLFIWKNITDLRLLVDHLVNLFMHLTKHLGYIKVICAAVIEIPTVLSERIKESRKIKIMDRQIFQMFERK